MGSFYWVSTSHSLSQEFVHRQATNHVTVGNGDPNLLVGRFGVNASIHTIHETGIFTDIW